MLRIKTENGGSRSDPTEQDLADLLGHLSAPDNRFLVYEHTSDANSYIQTYLRPEGDYRLEYREGGATSHYRTVGENCDSILRAFAGWARETGTWREEFTWEHAYPVPDRIPIAREPDYRTALIGGYDAGLFLAGFCRVTYLHMFDREGRHQGSHLAPAEQALGKDAPTDALMDHLRHTIDALPGRELRDIAVHPFSIERDGVVWGLIDESESYGFPHVELRPDLLGFNPPWDGRYDT